MTSNMSDEIMIQPELIINKSKYWSDRANQLQPILKKHKNIVLLGRGTSGNACVFASYLFGLSTGRHPIDFRPWLATQETPHADWSDSVVLSYTQSGESTDIIQATAWLKDRGAKVIAITNSQNKNPGIAKCSDEIFFLEAGEELAVPATKTYTAQLLATAALSGIDITNSCKEISEAMNNYLKSDIPDMLSDFIADKSVTMWLGRGLIQPAALDAALKLQETVNAASFGYSSAEFLHGPIGSLKEKDCVIIFDDTENNQVHDSTTDIIKVLDIKNIDYKIISGKVSGEKNINIMLPEQKWARTIMYSFIGQHIALKIAEKKGLNPDKPKGLKKITIT